MCPCIFHHQTPCPDKSFEPFRKNHTSATLTVHVAWFDCGGVSVWKLLGKLRIKLFPTQHCMQITNGAVWKFHRLAGEIRNEIIVVARTEKLIASSSRCLGLVWVKHQPPPHETKGQCLSRDRRVDTCLRPPRIGLIKRREGPEY